MGSAEHSLSNTTVPLRIGFISTRFQGTDGVTLEAKKWARILEAMGHSCFWMGGVLDTPPETSHLVPHSFFRHPEIAELHQSLFGVIVRHRAITNRIQALKEKLKDEIYGFLEKFHINLLVPQNILAIPLHIPLGLAMTEVIAETGLPVIAHHHDFAWERERFTINAVGDYLQASFPPSLPGIEHVVINSMAQKELARRLGIPSAIIPNILEYEVPPPGIDNYNSDLRHEIGLKADDFLILQPTRVIARKGIEHSIELVRRLKDPRAKLVISHPAGDEGDAYMRMLHDRIEDARIDVRFIADRVGDTRAINSAGKKVYTLFDLYPHADLVTYPSHYEGFGNAFLEAVYFGRPVVVFTYAVYARDIHPLGFKTIEINPLVTGEVVEKTRQILVDQSLRTEWAGHNYRLGLKHFSFTVAQRKIKARLSNLLGEV